MPLYEVVLEQRLLQQQIINRWNYVGTGTPSAVTPSFALLSVMGFLAVSTTFVEGTVAGELQQLQTPDTIFFQASARAVFVDEDFYGNGFLAGTIGTGTVGGDTASPILSFGFRSTRVLQSIGRGYKRFAGMAEPNAGQGGLLSAPTLVQMTSLGTAMSDPLVYDDEGNSLTFTPCIAQKEKYTTPSGKEAYRYYATEALQAPHLAIGINWETYDRQRSQVSRQIGRGS